MSGLTVNSGATVLELHQIPRLVQYTKDRKPWGKGQVEPYPNCWAVYFAASVIGTACTAVP